MYSLSHLTLTHLTLSKILFSSLPCPAHTPGRWCGLTLVGPVLGNYQYGLAFTRNRTRLPDSVVNAINYFIAEATETGERA